MIWESHPWRVDLYKRAVWLKAKKTQRRWSEASGVRVEQCVMIGCYCVRKLVEAGKVTDLIARRPVPTVVYKALGKPVHFKNWHRVDELYDLANGIELAKPLSFVCNQLIHSFVYLNGFAEEGGLECVLFSSDHERNTNLFQVSVDDLADAFGAVANDDVVEFHLAWNPKKKDYDRVMK